MAHSGLFSLDSLSNQFDMLDDILYFINSSYNKEINLNLLAEEASYSPYHFHRLFKHKTGEAPKQYIQRLRLEKACKELVFYPDKTIYEISLECGFSSPSVFARAFRKKYNLSAEEYRELELQKISHQLIGTSLPKVEVVKVDKFLVLSEMILLDDVDNVIKAFRNIHRWLKARDILPTVLEFYGSWLDSPVTTAMENCRYQAGVRVAQKVEAKGKELLTLGGENYASLQVSGNMQILSEQAIKVKNEWLAKNGYKVKQGVLGYEQFEGVDFEKGYSAHSRKIFIGVEPE
jgi:AraC family transcriptional regulator